jgi:hypothetical protein
MFTFIMSNESVLSLQNHNVFLLQVDLSEPILSRFDILCVVRDLVDPIQVTTIYKIFLVKCFSLTACGFHSCDVLVCMHFESTKRCV